jgi:radical SAM protein with 4Fe4S-binding SPASM domain
LFKKKFIPHSMALELTLECNMRCMHCGSAAGNIRKNELSTNEWIALCKDASNLGCKRIGLLGGEPFLRKDWFDIAQNIKDFGMDLSIVTNGSLIDDKLISDLKIVKPHSVSISLDGGTAETHDSIRRSKGSFEQCKKAFNLLREANIPTTAVSTVHKMNLKELPIIRSLLLNKGIAWQIQIADASGRCPENIHVSKEEFYSIALFIATTRNQYSVKELPVTGGHCIGYNSSFLPNVTIPVRWTGCQAGVSVLGVESDGGVKGCLSLSPKFIEDNIRNKSLIEIWNDPNSFAYNRRFKTEHLKDGCKDCKYGKTCKGGCTSASYSSTGKTHCDPYCLYLLEKEMMVRPDT